MQPNERGFRRTTPREHKDPLRIPKAKRPPCAARFLNGGGRSVPEQSQRARNAHPVQLNEQAAPRTTLRSTPREHETPTVCSEMSGDPSRPPHGPPRTPKDLPRDATKRAPCATKRAGIPKDHPKGAQGPPRIPKDLPRDPQERARAGSPKDHAKDHPKEHAQRARNDNPVQPN